MISTRPSLAAVILTGGTAVRLGGADKGSLEIGGTTLLEHVLAAQREPHLGARGAEVLQFGLDPEGAEVLEHPRESPGHVLDREDPPVADLPHGISASTISAARAPLETAPSMEGWVVRSPAMMRLPTRVRGPGRECPAPG